VGNLEFETPEAAEHHIRTTRGRASAADARYQESRIRVLELEREIAQLKGGAKPANASPEPPARPPAAGREPAPASNGEKWQVAAHLRKAFGDEAADAYLQQESQKEQEAALATLRQELTSSLDERLKVVDSLKAHQERVAKANQIVGLMQTYRNQDGTPAYPELADTPEGHRESAAVRAFWLKSGGSEEQLFDPFGLHTAIAVYRQAKAQMTRSAAPKAATTTPPAPPAPVSPITPTAEQAGLVPGRPERLADAITKAPLPRDEFWGFQVRPGAR
jgi:hypothetical protein